MVARTQQRRRARESADTWRERIERWKQSGLGAEEFAKSEGVTRQALGWWSWNFRRPLQLQGTRPQYRKDAPRPQRRRRVRHGGSVGGTFFVPVEVIAPSRPAAASAIKIVLRGGITLKVTSGLDEPTLRRIVQVLGGE